jgi:uncharacterized protein YggE
MAGFEILAVLSGLAGSAELASVAPLRLVTVFGAAQEHVVPDFVVARLSLQASKEWAAMVGALLGDPA